MNRVLALFVAIPSLSAQAIAAQDVKIEQCPISPEYSQLDFWLGDWEVFADQQKVGDNRIEKILGGCIVMEHWTGADGKQGKSVFYYDLVNKTWKQLWFTQWANFPGGIKEKILVKKFRYGGVRFQGLIANADGGTYLDRTTLTPLANGNVRQLIEVSEDEGDNWRPTFDAIYKRREVVPPARV